jgi:tetratricopeptide (TPR) repeat protein
MVSRFLSTVVLILILFGSIFAQEENGNNEARMLFNEGIAEYKKANVNSAIEKFKASIEKDPNLAISYYGLGIAYKKKRDLVNAEKNYQIAIEKDPQMVRAYTALGLLQLQQQKYVPAINTFKAAVKIKPDEVKALWGIADAYRRQDDYRTAIEYYQKAVETDMTYANAWEGYGTCLYNLGRYSDAIESLNQAIQNEKRESSKADTYLRIGNSHMKLKNYAAAEDAYKNCLNVVRSSTIRAGANFGLGEIYKERGQNDTAIAYFQKASRDRNWQQPALYQIDLIKNGDKYTY